MSLEASYTEARDNLASLCQKVTNDHEVVIIRRRGHRDVALVAADELAGLTETAHLLKSPKNRQRLLRTLKRAKARRGKKESVATLAREVGLGKAG